MSEEKKSRYTEAQARSAKKYLTETVEDVRIRVPKGQKAIIKAHAESQGESMNQFVVRLFMKQWPMMMLTVQKNNISVLPDVLYLSIMEMP